MLDCFVITHFRYFLFMEDFGKISGFIIIIETAFSNLTTNIFLDFSDHLASMNFKIESKFFSAVFEKLTLRSTICTFS